MVTGRSTNARNGKGFAKRNGYEFHLLTDKDLLSFVDIPKDIIEKNKKNELTLAAFF